MSYVLDLRFTSETFAAMTGHNPCFHINFFSDSEDAEWISGADFQRGLAKWTSRILKVVVEGLDPESHPGRSRTAVLSLEDQRCAARNMLLFLEASVPAFPKLRRYF